MLSSIRNGLKHYPRRRTTTTTSAAIGALRSTVLGNFFEIPWSQNEGSSAAVRSFSSDVAAVAGRRKWSPPSSSSSEDHQHHEAQSKPSSGPSEAAAPPPTSSSSSIPHWVRTPIDLALLKAVNANDLWRLAAKYELSADQAVGFFVALSKFALTDSSIDYARLSSTPKKDIFNIVSESLIADGRSLNPGNTALALRSVLSIGTPENEKVVVQLRKKLLELFALLGLPTLASFAQFHARYADSTELGKELQSAMLNWLFKNADNFNDPKHALLLLSLTARQDSNSYKSVETKLCELLPSFTGDDLCRLVNILASKRIRSVLLLKGVANRYVACQDDLSVKKLAQFLTDLGALNFPNMKILTALFNDIESKLDAVTNPSVISGIFASLAIMRLRSVELLDALCRWTQKHLQEFSHEELATVVVTLGRCNYTFEEGSSAATTTSSLLGLILKKAWMERSKYEKPLWLDFVWSLAILQRLDQSTAASVLDKAFYERLLDEIDENGYKLMTTQLKLRNINTAARLEIPGYKGPFLNVAADFGDNMEINVARYKQESVTVLGDSLNNLAPREKYMKTSIACAEGYVIDALIRLTSSGKPVPVADWDKAPPDSWPIAVILRDFHEVTQFSNSTIGLHVMATRHLNALGYLVLEIPADEIEQRRQPIARVKFLKEKLDEIIATQRSSS